MREVVIASSVRTPVGRAFKGTLRATRPDELAAVAIKGALERVPQVDAKEIEDVILGCANCVPARGFASRGLGADYQPLLLVWLAGDCDGGGTHHERWGGNHRCRWHGIDVHDPYGWTQDFA
jgi:hypothetical protein